MTTGNYFIPVSTDVKCMDAEEPRTRNANATLSHAYISITDKHTPHIVKDSRSDIT